MERDRQCALGLADAPELQHPVITELAHTAVHVPDIDAAIEVYRDVLGFEVLSPPYRMEGAAIAADMGELVPAPVVVTAAIVGLPGDSGGNSENDRVLELIEYPMLGNAALPREGRAP